jgi:hypothetical protein
LDRRPVFRLAGAERIRGCGLVACEQGPHWVRRVIEGLDRDVELPAIGVTLPLAEIYDEVAFSPRRRLVRRDEADTQPQ